MDRYQIVDRLGVGGMGTVYRANHTLLEGRTVAVKMLHRELSQNPEVVNRFFREAKAASRVENEHIVEVIDFGVSSEGDSFLVMEFLDGPSLRDLLEDHGPMSLSRALAVGVQIAEGLYSAHRAGIIHRDLKPENVVLVRREGHRFVKLLDFGIAKLTELEGTTLTVAGMVVGTPTYMSPEQAGGEDVDHRTDLYALGTILYEMLTGVPPFTGDTTKQLLLAQLTQQPRPPRELRPEIPATVEAVILHTLEKDRDRRPPNMLQLAVELRDALKGQMPAVQDPLDAMIEGGASPEEVESTLRVEPAPGPLRRFLPLIGMGAGLLLGILVTVAIMWPDASAPTAVAGTKPDGGPVLDQRVAARALDSAPAVAVVAPDARLRRRIRRPRRNHRPAPRRPRPRRPAPPSPSSSHRARVTSVPSGAAVYERDIKLGRTPLEVDTGRARTLTIHADGHEARVVALAKHRESPVTVKLKRSTLSWEVLSLSQLKRMMERGQISRFTYKRRRADLIKKRDRKIMQLRVKHKMGHITEEQYKRAVQAVKDSYR